MRNVPKLSDVVVNVARTCLLSQIAPRIFGVHENRGEAAAYSRRVKIGSLARVCDAGYVE